MTRRGMEVSPSDLFCFFLEEQASDLVCFDL